MRAHSRTNIYYLIAALAMAVYHLILPMYSLEGLMGWKETHLIFALVLVFMGIFLRDKRSKFRLLMVTLILLSVVSVIYFKVVGQTIEIERPGAPSLVDVMMGWIIVFVVLYGCWLAWGYVLPSLALIAIAYMLLGSYLPGPLRSHPIDLDMTISLLGASHMGTGIFGMLIGVSAGYLFLFLLLGGLIQGSGASKFFEYIGRLVSRSLPGGTVLAAIGVSCLAGTVSGAPAANVGMTGVYTIPAMKKDGIHPETAAAIESCSATGASFIPPVLGGTAFLMMGLTGIPYIEICKMTVVIGLLYYFALGLQAVLMLRKMRPSLRVSERMPVDYKDMALRAPFLLVPILTLSALMIMMFSPTYAAFWAIISLLVVIIIMKPVRPSLRSVIDGVISGAAGGAKLAVALACVGIIVVGMTSTGLGLKLPMMISSLAGGSLLVTALLVWLVVTLLGCGIPGNAAYVITAIVAAPALVKLGAGVAQTHEFIFVVSCAAAITPPVAMAAMVSAAIAEASYLKTAIEAVKFGLNVFLLAFLPIWVPEIMLLGTSLPWTLAILLATVAAICMEWLVIRGFFITEMTWLERAGAALAMLLLLDFVVTRSYFALAGGCVFSMVVILWQISRGRQKRRVYATP